MHTHKLCAFLKICSSVFELFLSNDVLYYVSCFVWIPGRISTVLSRVQVVKMSRRLAGLERQNAECRQTELVLFSLLLSACLLNGWLWIRR
uniref:Mff-like domain-containing protein n=1 Tax=Oncorhynchus kisutch TaxID=8019 RepID=A0A8C7KXV5_ONCKI